MTPILNGLLDALRVLADDDATAAAWYLVIHISWFILAAVAVAALFSLAGAIKHRATTRQEPLAEARGQADL